MEFGYILAGFVVGFLVGLTGVGGGSLMTPILLLIYNIKPAVAVGTDLLYASITKSVGIFAHGKLGNIDWVIVKRLATGSVPASMLTLWALHSMDLQSGNVVSTIKFWLGVALIVTSVAVLLRNKLMSLVAKEEWIPARYVPGATVVLGTVLGALVTLTSVGAGALGVTALILLYPKEKITTIVGSDIAHAVPLTLVAGLGHASLGTIDYHLLGTLLIGSIPGIYLGSHLSSRVAEHWVRIALAMILIFVGFKLIFH
ncbi:MULTISPECIES: sulfite exporter TauE/SafE family protein [unclassified Methylophilus]|uniref:sulfite exporter TauE/SafE family protein n=1 Tax=unclassified Methylophilus TaxID=2630143 RepID=UPI00037CA7CE|nr:MULTISPECIES: sulfite exporter TauE/SafE family protein [unclassified Methylophilus]HCU85587.1 sulfite exporter TauE/SafE family protein [Methylophilus sp.]